MGDLFDIANLITTVGVDAVKIKPEPGLPEKSSNEILTELFSTFDVPDDDEENEAGSSSSDEDKKNKKSAKEVKVKVEKDDDGKRRKAKKKKHRHKSESKDREKKHKHKKKSKNNTSESGSDPENSGSKKKKKKKRSKRKYDQDSKTDTDEPSAKVKKLDKSSKEQSNESADQNEKSKTDVPETVKIKKEKEDPVNVPPISETKTDGPPPLPPIQKRLDDDAEAIEVPKLLEKSKNPPACKILIKDLKNSEVYNNVIKEVENKEKEKAERMEDGEISDSDEDEVRRNENRTPTLSPSPPRGRVLGTMVSDRKRHSLSPPSSKRIVKKNDLRLVLKEKEKKKQIGDSSSSRNDPKRRSNRSNDRSISSHSRDRRTRSRSADRNKFRGRSREKRNNRRGGRGRNAKNNNRYNSRSEDRNRRGRSRSKERKERIEIDKKKLLEIARRNAINMIMKGKLPIAQQDKAIAAIQSGGKTIDELTDFCKTLSRSEAMGELSSISSGDESESEKGFHHPFLLKERPSSIIMNIRDAKQLPTKTLLEKTTDSKNLSIQYPVSSGQQHRKNESEWIPVPPKPKNPKPEAKKLFIPAKEVFQPPPLPLVVPPVQVQQAAQAAQQMAYAQSMQATQPMPLMQTMLPDQQMLPGQLDPSMQMLPGQVDPSMQMQPGQLDPSMQMQMPIGQLDPSMQMQMQHGQLDPSMQMPMPQEMEQQTSIFPSAPTEQIDISAIVSQRLSAMRKLSENPNDSQALKEMYKAQTGMQSWVESKQSPGQFTGSTGARVLSQAELNSGHQAWARKDQLLTAQPVSGGMGMALLQKMGWKPGEGLGKNKEGTLEPLKLEVKLDKKGLASDQEIAAHKLGKNPKSHHAPPIKSMEGKHPVSLLGEYCSKYKYGAPVYELCFECGPDHKKNFLFKVKVNGVEYQPSVASPNKKLAKAEAAQVCLQNIGILP